MQHNYNIVTQAHPPSHSPGGTGQAGSTRLPQSRHLLVLGLVLGPKFLARSPLFHQAGARARRPASAAAAAPGSEPARDAVRDCTGKGRPSVPFTGSGKDQDPIFRASHLSLCNSL